MKKPHQRGFCYGLTGALLLSHPQHSCLRVIGRAGVLVSTVVAPTTRAGRMIATANAFQSAPTIAAMLHMQMSSSATSGNVKAG